MKRQIYFIFLTVLLLFSTLHAKSNSEPSNSMLLTTHDGKIIDINITEDGFKFKQFEGKTVLLNFFGPMCPPCIIEIPHLIELQKSRKDELQIIAIQVQVPMENSELDEFLSKNRVNYPVINLNDAWDIVSFIKANTSWGGEIPFTLMFDKSGNLKRTYMGLISSSKLIKDMHN